MIFSLLKYLGGYLEVSLKGYAPERFLNLCSSHNILIWDMYKGTDDYHFKISLRAFWQIRPFVRKTKTKVRILHRYGLPFWLYRYRQRKLYFAGIALACMLLWIMSQFIWNIELIGNSKVTKDTLMKFLTESGCDYGSAKRTIDCEALEAKIRERFDEVIWTSVQIQGTKLTVFVKESLLPVHAGTQTQENYTASDLIAPSDGVVASIITRSGTPCVQAGDTVETGDILVSGRIDLHDDNGEISAYHYCNADADIYLTMAAPYQDEIKISYERKAFTGTIAKRYSLVFFSKIVGPFRKEPVFDSFDFTTEYRQWRLYQDFFLPVILRVDTYREYTLVPEIYSETELKSMAEEHLQIYLEQIKQKDVQILEKNVIMDMYENKLVVSGSILIQEKISTRQQTEELEFTQESEGLDTDEFE